MLENVILCLELLQGIYYVKRSVLYFGLVFTVIFRLYFYADQGALNIRFKILMTVNVMGYDVSFSGRDLQS